MLSFMREQGTVNLTEQGLGATGADAAATGDEQGQQYLTVASRGKSVRKTTRLLAVLFVIGLLCLLFMIKRSVPQSASASQTGVAETQIELTIARLTGFKSQVFERMDQIVNRFYEFSDVRQVKVNELAKDPFKHDSLWSNLKQSPTGDESNADADKLLREQRLRQQAGDLRLLSIMNSPQGNCCMIDDRILYVGDSIKQFTIGKIQGNRVTLVWHPTEFEKLEIVLKLSE
jgi:preprotein translocase subunit SecG